MKYKKDCVEFHYKNIFYDVHHDNMLIKSDFVIDESILIKIQKLMFLTFRG